MHSIHLLIAEDEPALRAFLTRGLTTEGFVVDEVSQLADILDQLKRAKPDVLILDRMFGQQDSLSLLPKIKQSHPQVLILLLTALDDTHDKIVGLQQGADDYLGKPFDFDELIARVHALARRSKPQQHSISDKVTMGKLTLDKSARQVMLGNHELALTTLEFDLLLYLIENVNRVVTRERILSRVWKNNADPQTNVVDVYISKLRGKLDGDVGCVIQTIRGNGYRLSAQSSPPPIS